MSYTLIERRELTSNASSISFDNIPEFYTDLMILFSIRTTRSGQKDDLIPLRINGTTTNQTEREMFGTGSSVGTSAGLGAIYGYANAPNATANTFGNGSFYICNYRATSPKVVSVER